MKKYAKWLTFFGVISLLSGCNTDSTSLEEQIVQAENDRFKVGIVLTETGLGDQSLGDLAIQGLIDAEENLNIIWTYKEADTEPEAINAKIQELIDENHDIIINVSYSALEPFEEIAKENPEQQFLLIDIPSDTPNIDAITFKENEGSYLAGIVAARTSETGVIGFMGGFEEPVILKFLDGYKKGAQSVNPDIQVLVDYAESYSDTTIGTQIAQEMIAQQADVLYAVAGSAGVGMLKEAQRQNVYAIGVDTDQYYYAEKAVITSMTKNVDITVRDYIKTYMEKAPTEQQIIEAGIAENGVGLAPIRVLENADELEREIEQAKQEMQ